MNTRESTEKEYIDAKQLIHEQLKEHQDEKVRTIYERYHSGKTIILDDLRYLWLKDPEGCKRITKTIIEFKSKQRNMEVSDNDSELNKRIDIGSFSKKAEEIIEQRNDIDVITGFDAPQKQQQTQVSQANVQEILTSMKLVLEKMSNNDLMEMWKHINETLVLEKIGDKMRFWNDTFDEKIMLYTTEVEKRFNKLA